MQSDTELQYQIAATEINIENDANTSTLDDPAQNLIDVNEKENFDITPSTSKDIITVVHQLPSRAMSRRRKAEKSEILTSYPYKNALIENKAIKDKLPVVKMLEFKGKKTNDPTKIKKTKKTTATPKIKIKSQTSASSKSVTEKTNCLICQKDNDEDWICCQSCNEWVHEACADIEEGSLSYICDFCRL